MISLKLVEIPITTVFFLIKLWLTHSLTHHSFTEITLAYSRHMPGGLLIVLVKLYQLTHVR